MAEMAKTCEHVQPGSVGEGTMKAGMHLGRGRRYFIGRPRTSSVNCKKLPSSTYRSWNDISSSAFFSTPFSHHRVARKKADEWWEKAGREEEEAEAGRPAEDGSRWQWPRTRVLHLKIWVPVEVFQRVQFLRYNNSRKDGLRPKSIH